MNAREAKIRFKKYLAVECPLCTAQVEQLCRGGGAWVHIERFEAVWVSELKKEIVMPKVQKTVDLHPKTVKMIGSEDPKNYYKNSGARRRANYKRFSKLKKSHWTDGMAPEIIAWVKENHPGIHPARIQVFPPDAIIIHNKRYGGK